MSYFVYIHRSNDGTPFYVGQGKEYRPYDFNKRSNEWKQYARQHGVSVEIVAQFTTRKEAIKLETKLIEFYRTTLLNFGTTVDAAVFARSYAKEVGRKKGFISEKRGIPFSEEHKQALRKPKSTWYVCPHCNKGGATNMTRWHFDNCKEKA